MEYHLQEFWHLLRKKLIHFLIFLTRNLKNNYPADRIYNVDETGLTVVQTKVSVVIGFKGKR